MMSFSDIVPLCSGSVCCDIVIRKVTDTKLDISLVPDLAHLFTNRLTSKTHCRDNEHRLKPRYWNFCMMSFSDIVPLCSGSVCCDIVIRKVTDTKLDISLVPDLAHLFTNRLTSKTHCRDNEHRLKPRYWNFCMMSFSDIVPLCSGSVCCDIVIRKVTDTKLDISLVPDLAHLFTNRLTSKTHCR